MPMFWRRSITVIGSSVQFYLGTKFVCAFSVWDIGSVRKVTLSNRIDPRNGDLERSKQPTFNIICSWCGALIRTANVELPEQMCLICHARMLNDYFQRINKKPRTHADKRT